MLRLIASWVVVGLLAAAEPPPVPDPIGLGERLALIDHLQSAYAVRPPAGATLEQLQSLYAETWQAHQPVTTDPGATERVARLRARIASRHDVQTDPALDEEGLRAQLGRLDAEKTRRDQADIELRLREDQAGPRIQPAIAESAAASPSTAPPATPTTAPADASAKPAESDGLEVQRIAFSASGVTDCWLATSGDRTALLVTFGLDRNGAFVGIRERAWAILRNSSTIKRGVLLLGHGRGTRIAGASISAHLAAHKTFYETMGGTAPAKPIECLAFAACSGGVSQSQMLMMRDGLGYFPTWRVATGEDAAANGLTVLAALDDIAKRPSVPAYRARYMIRFRGDEITSFGEVGVGGERTSLVYWRIVQTDSGGWRIEEQR